MNGLVLTVLMTAATPDTERLALRAAVHIHTTFSDGSHSVEEIAKRAGQEGIDVVVLGDHFLTRVEYGPPLLRKALAVSVRLSSLSPQDLDLYSEAARKAERQTGVLVLPGVEIAPFYYWTGNPLSGRLTLNSAHRHLLVVFPERPDLVGLARALTEMSAPGIQDFTTGSLLLAWPFLPALWAVNRLRRSRRSLLAWFVAAASVAALVRSWPYPVPRFSPYAGDAGAAPYQEAVNMARSTSSLTFWAHPETSVESRHPRYPVVDRSDKYPELISGTRGATGFASLYEGYRQAAAPAGPWDQALKEFVRGERPWPVWTLGELDLHEQGEAGGKHLSEVETVVLAKERSRGAVIEALATGSMYAVRQPGTSRLTLERFQAVCSGHEGGMGERATVMGPCRIEAVLRSGGVRLQEVAVTLIRNGEVVSERSVDIAEEGVKLEWDEDGPSHESLFFRLVARRGNRLALYGNPIFVDGEEGAP